VFGIAEVWRRLTFRYIHDLRRRRQFLILTFRDGLPHFPGHHYGLHQRGQLCTHVRRVCYGWNCCWFANRVAIRITVAGVTGDVIGVGLGRLYLMELAGTGIDLYSTGRIVVFSNSVLFQATAPLFKQLPGTQYVWHEVAVSFSQSADYPLVQKALHTVVDSVHKELGPKTDDVHHHGARDDRVEIMIGPPKPEYRLQFAEAGLELAARYPVGLRGAAQIDDKITAMLLDAIRQDEKIANDITGIPDFAPP
jgi:hypothetical protein